jgi:hypothetical protein
MKLEVGKYYKTRGGGKVRVAGRREFAADNYPFLVESTSGNYYSVSEDGRFNDGYTDSFDLIEEWRDPVTYTRYIHMVRCKRTGEIQFSNDHRKFGAHEFHFSDLLEVKEVSFTI